MPNEVKLVLDAAISTQWAIEASWLALILDVIQRENQAPADLQSKYEAVATQQGTPVDGAKRLRRRGNVATLPVYGPIVRRADYFSEISALTSVDSIASDLQVARTDPSIKGILLDMDSPGGDVNGISELAQIISAINAEKPVWAYANHMMASAAYWLASAADRIIVNATSPVGSIGIVGLVRNSQRAGVLEFVSSQSPRKRADVNTEAGRAQVQQTIDALADEFIADVATYRGVKAQKVIEDFGRGGILLGRAAISVGMADALGTYEGTLKQLAEMDIGRRMPRARKPRLAAEDETLATIMATEKEGDQMPSFMEKVKAMISEEEGQSGQPKEGDGTQSQPQKPAAAAVPAPADGTSAHVQATGATATAPDPALLMRAITGECSAFVAEQKAAGRMAPAEAEAFTKDYIRRAQDDAAHPVAAGESTRVDSLKATITARPVNPLLKGDLLPGTTAAVAGQTGAQGQQTGLHVVPAASDGGADSQITPEREAHLLGQTYLGQQELAARNNTARS